MEKINAESVASGHRLDANDWDNRYLNHATPWDLGEPAPPFVSLLAAAAAPHPGKMAVLGSGKGEDALWFAKQGFTVVGFDFAPSAIAHSQAIATAKNLSAQFLERDIFTLGHEFANEFDYVLEHTCFCAIDPALRMEYVDVIQTILHPQGQLIGLFWAHQRQGGPPFGTSVAEIQRLFGEKFTIDSLSLATDSIQRRRGEEYLMRSRVRKLPQT